MENFRMCVYVYTILCFLNVRSNAFKIIKTLFILTLKLPFCVDMINF